MQELEPTPDKVIADAIDKEILQEIVPTPELRQTVRAAAMAAYATAATGRVEKGIGDVEIEPPAPVGPRKKTRDELIMDYDRELRARKNFPRPVRRQLVQDFRKELAKRKVD